MKTLLKLYLISHGIPVRISTKDAFAFYQRAAKFHGFHLVRRSYGFVFD